MRRIELNIDNLHWAGLSKSAALVLLLAGLCCLRSVAQQPGQKTFSTAEEASSALVAAVQSDDEKAMLGLFGADGKEIISSGDAAEDARGRANFLEKYREMHRLVNEPDGTTTLYIGARNWPTPIPLMKKGNSWYFDTEAGKQEILYRRIGRNELSAIRVCQELVSAENEYHHTQHDEYAKRITSDDGRHDGLYWRAAAGEPQSPIGPLVASAVAEGYANGISALTPYRGYYFRILARQGKHGPGGAKSYSVDGKLTEGFAFVAFPAQYRSSGVMTFIVGGDGVVYEKDLGKETSVVAKLIKAYDPDTTWRKAEEAQASARDSETK
ncbi:MAG: DUF2950 domain-containing protein [Steroidobacteraceae bacterium]